MCRKDSNAADFHLHNGSHHRYSRRLTRDRLVLPLILSQQCYMKITIALTQPSWTSEEQQLSLNLDITGLILSLTQICHRRTDQNSYPHAPLDSMH